MIFGTESLGSSSFGGGSSSIAITGGSAAKLVSVVGDINTHGAGQLQTPPQTKWTVNGKLVCTIDTIAVSDNFGHSVGSTNPSTGQNKWTIAGKAIHRNNDNRYCGAQTIVSGQTKFTVG